MPSFELGNETLPDEKIGEVINVFGSNDTRLSDKMELIKTS